VLGVDHARGRLGLALNGGCGAGARAASARERIEQSLGRLAAHHLVGDMIRLVRIAGAAVDAAAELDPGALLDDVRGLVRGGVQIRRAREADAIADREGARAELAGGLRGGPATRSIARGILPTMNVEELAAAVRRIDSRIGLELQWDLREDDDMHWMLALHVIVERPGRDHSRYSTVEIAQFEADEIQQRRDAQGIAAAVAEATALPLHAPPIEDRGGQGDSAWIRTQPEGSPHAYELTWEARWWTDDGEPANAGGVEHVAASSGYNADIQLSRVLERRFPSRPLSLNIRGSGGRYDDIGSCVGAGWPASLPDRERVREIALTEGCRASGIARGLVARVSELTTLALMIAFSEGFAISLEALAPLAGWRKGALDDAELDAALPHIARHREGWDRVRRLRETHAAGKGFAAFLREERRHAGSVRLGKDLMDAFGISLRDAKELVDDCGDPRNDVKLGAPIGIFDTGTS